MRIQNKILQKSPSKESESFDGPAEVRNPDDASGARIEVFRFAQYLNDDKRISVYYNDQYQQNQNPLMGPLRFELRIPAV